MPSISPATRFETLIVRRASTWPIVTPQSPVPLSPWQAASLLQKAIRRGDVERTQQAVWSLLSTDPVRMWRRLGVIAFEDIGLANLPLVGQVLVALRGKTLRRSLGGEMRVAIGIATDLALSPKNRSADDLLCVLNSHPDIPHVARKFAGMSAQRLLYAVSGDLSVTEASVAARKFAINCNSSPSYVPTELLNSLGVGPSVEWLAQEGGKRTRTMLPLLVALLSRANGLKQENPDDEFPEEIEIAGQPGWALDMFTREGKAAIRRLMAGSSEVARFARDTFPYAGRAQLLGEAVFRVESGLLRNRQDGPLGQTLRSQMERECLGIDLGHAEKLLPLMKAAIPELNDCRRVILGRVGQ